MRTIGEMLPRCPGKGKHLPVDQIYVSRQRYPELYGAVLMACVDTQTNIVQEIWNDEFPMDGFVPVAWRALTSNGELPRILAKTDEARLMFRCAYAGAQTQYYADKVEI